MALDLGTVQGTLALNNEPLVQAVNSSSQKLYDVNDIINVVQTSVGKLGQGFSDFADKAKIDALKDISKDLSSLNDGFLEAAGKADDLRDSLAGAFGDNADSVADFIDSVGIAQGVLDNSQLEAASKTLQKLGAFSEENLTLLADVAVGAGTSVDSLADSLGKFEKFQDAKTFKALQKAIGASIPDLEALGVQFTEKGALATDLEGNVERATAAIKEFANTKYGGALARVSDDSAKLQGELTLLKQELGENQFAFLEWANTGILSGVQALRGLPPEVKGATGLLVGLGGNLADAGTKAALFAANLKILGIGGAGAGLTGLFTAIKTAGAASFAALNVPVGVAIKQAIAYTVAQAKQLTSNALNVASNFTLAGSYTTLNGAVAASTAAISGATLAFAGIGAAVGVAIIAYTELEKEVTAANEALLKSDDLQSKGVKDVQSTKKFSTNKILTSSLKDLEKGGLTVNTVSQRILDEVRGAEQLRENGDTIKAKAAFARVAKLKEIRIQLKKELDQQAKEEAEANRPLTKAEKKAQKEADKDAKKLEEDKFKDALQEIKLSEKSAEQKIKDLKTLRGEYEDDAGKRRQITGLIAAEEKKAAAEKLKATREAQKESNAASEQQYKNSLQEINLSGKSSQQKIDDLQNLQAVYTDDANKVRQINSQIASEEKKIAAEKSKKQKEETREKIKAQKEVDREIAKQAKNNKDTSGSFATEDSGLDSIFAELAQVNANKLEPLKSSVFVAVKDGISEGVKKGVDDSKTELEKLNPSKISTDFSSSPYSIDDFFAKQKADFNLSSPFENRTANKTLTPEEKAALNSTVNPLVKNQGVNGPGIFGEGASLDSIFAPAPVTIPLSININGQQRTSGTIQTDATRAGSSQFNTNYTLGEV